MWFWLQLKREVQGYDVQSFWVFMFILSIFMYVYMEKNDINMVYLDSFIYLLTIFIYFVPELCCNSTVQSLRQGIGWNSKNYYAGRIS